MAKKIDLGVSTGPNASELATIRSGNKRTKSARAAAVEESISRKGNVGPEMASKVAEAMKPERPTPLDESEQRKIIARGVNTETSTAHVLPGGRNNPTAFQAPGSNSENPTHTKMASHLADYIEAGKNPARNRGKLESARAGFHALRLENRGTPKGMETPCTGPSCNKTAGNGATSCGDSGCSTSGVNVSRPRG
jgi:hypothetical protein